MPELPEVETMRRGIQPIVGATIVAAERTPCSKRPIAITPRIDRLQKRIAGQKIDRIDRLGKRVVVVTENEDRLIFEPRMTGLVLISQPPTAEHLRFRLQLKGRKAKELLFWDRRGLGNVCCLSNEEYQQKLLSGKLGPDAMVITSDEFRERFRILRAGSQSRTLGPIGRCGNRQSLRQRDFASLRRPSPSPLQSAEQNSVGKNSPTHDRSFGTGDRV